MAQEAFPRSALADNRAGRLTAEQIAALRADAGKSKRSGVLAGLALSAFGLFILWGTLAGRVPGSRLQSLAVGAAFAIVGGLFLRSGGRTRGSRAEEAASQSTVLERVEGPFRRKREDRQVVAGSSHTMRGSARYLYYLHVGDRRFSVGERAYEAAPDDGIVRVYVLPGSDVVVNLERIAEEPPTPLEVRAAAVLRERFGAVPPGEGPQGAGDTTTPEELRAALIGRWEDAEMSMQFEFRPDGTVVTGRPGAGEETSWEVLDAGRIRIDGDEQRVRVAGGEFFLVTRGPTFRFRRVPVQA